MVKKKRVNRRQIKAITEDEVFDTWSIGKVNYSKSFRWNLCHQILSDLTKKVAEQTSEKSYDLLKIVNAPIDVDSLIKSIINLIDVVVDRSFKKPSVYITNIDNPHLLTDDIDNLDTLVTQLFFDHQQVSKVKRESQSKDVTYRINDVLSKLEYIDDIRFLPNTYISTASGIYDIESKRYLTEDEAEEYDLTYKYSWYVMNDDIYERLSDEERLEYDDSLTQLKTAFYNWSCRDAELIDFDPDKCYLLKQVMLKAVLGLGSGRFIVLSGDGGNGKSSYLECIQALIGDDYVAEINIHDIANQNKLAKIHSNTKVVIGKDAATNTHLKDVSLSIFKSLIQGESVLIDEKYKQSRYIKLTGPYIQATNTAISFHENSDAIRDRLLNVEMSPVNFRNHDKKIDLRKILSSKLGKIALATLIINDVDEIYSYRITDEMKALIDENVNNADSLTQFIDEIKDEFFGIRLVCDEYLYDRYKSWQSDNMSGNPMSSQNFKKAILKHMHKLGYFEVYDEGTRRRSRRHFNPNKFNPEDCFTYLNSYMTKKGRIKNNSYYIMKYNEI